jgi:microcystin-dependent protein
MEGVLAVITQWAPDFAPKGWAFCNGQILPIAQNQALFSLLGTTFGGNGINTFALPNMQSRTPIGTGQGGAISNVTLGEITGSENVTLTIGNLPAHNHTAVVNLSPMGSDNPDSMEASGNVPADISNGYASSATTGTFMNPPVAVSNTIGTSGGSQPFSILSPYLAVNYIICTQGLFPSRN